MAAELPTLPITASTDATDEDVGNNDASSREVLTVEELAALLRLNRKSVYAAIQRGEIPGVRRIGNAVRISRSVVLSWLEDGPEPWRASRPKR